ncbi:Fe-S cluster assembly sulfur transfer protein SufU [Microbacterium ulmi]|uniref:SUF system NifU family Fe-S cluster assembly protein n=1 Tax=Microbacterium ulmi TaxID=179095 RepID=A0A7Y2M0I6_9MICO|nr:SUF system NifU family Fe-S cluster assembly protein [Microbacterium ulmi]NII69563.1 nitrogen fixation NifU-like protein [Microbacterium ulmi]NNH03549.1 SUF system NifU family Fe-S cluster assembly protein [Microbacterium ulmi]
MSLDALYQELILDHAKRRVGFGLAPEEGATASSHQRNPICGDEIEVRVRVDGDVVRDVTWEGAGCSISQASASMLAELVAKDPDGVVRELPRGEASVLVNHFREALRSRGTVLLDEDEFGDAAALSGVSKYTARVKCAMLAWVAFEDALSRA